MNETVLHITVLWHSRQNMLPNRNILAMEYTPVVYSCGQGLYSISSYLNYVDGVPYIILDNVFTITQGNHPMDDVPVLCDSIKNAVQQVVSKTIAIVKMETELQSVRIQIDVFNQSEHIPSQLNDITKWINKELIIDYNAEISNDGNNNKLYFQESNELTSLSTYISRWDQFYTISHAIIGDLVDILSSMNVRDDQIPIIESIIPNIEQLCSELDSFQKIVQQKIQN